MASMPEPVVRMLKHPDTNKAMATIGEDGRPHVIVCGSLCVVDDDTIVVGDALMSRTRGNLDRNPEVEFLVWLRKDAYSIKARFTGRQDSGPVYDDMVKNLDKINLWPSSICLFSVEEIWDESASPSAGSRVVRWIWAGGGPLRASSCWSGRPSGYSA